MMIEAQAADQDTDVPTIDFYFDFISPFGWIAAERIGALAADQGRRVVWKPILLGVTVGGAMGLPPLLETPLKGPYLLRDARRQARLYGLNMANGTDSVFSSVAAARAILWTKRNAPQAVESLVLALYRRRMSDGLDIATAASVISVAATIGIDTDALGSGIEDPAIKVELKRAVDEAIAKGIFGSPTIVVDGEPFWGSDRVDQAIAWIALGGW